MDRAFILSEIKRTAAENGGAPLGRSTFLAVTGIKQTDWYGKRWARWGDALIEAGFNPNQLQEAYDDNAVLEKIAAFVEELGHFPVAGELRMRAKAVKGFPSHTTIGRLGSKTRMAARLAEFADRIGKFNVAHIAESIAASGAKRGGEETRSAPAAEETFGFVYLVRSSRFYKIGRSNAVGRRERELAIQLPEKVDTVHVIRTDDPVGIERYWHRRFADKRKNGEWFELSAADIAAFKRRKFM